MREGIIRLEGVWLKQRNKDKKSYGVVVGVPLH
jgi:hypothetical protein